jgi:hypothetical protein
VLVAAVVEAVVVAKLVVLVVEVDIPEQQLLSRRQKT